MQGRLVEAKAGDKARAEKMGVGDFEQLQTELTLAPGDKLRFAATGVTDGELLRGITYWGNGCRTHSLVMGLDEPRRVRFVDTIHVEDSGQLEVRV
jgi:fructose-1,6-bisphosphatase II